MPNRGLPLAVVPGWARIQIQGVLPDEYYGENIQVEKPQGSRVD
jgi:hypothetical protein